MYLYALACGKTKPPFYTRANLRLVNDIIIKGAYDQSNRYAPVYRCNLNFV
jgi:hypothetical protein